MARSRRCQPLVFSTILGGGGGGGGGGQRKLGILLYDPEEEHDCFSNTTHHCPTMTLWAPVTYIPANTATLTGEL